MVTSAKLKANASPYSLPGASSPSGSDGSLSPIAVNRGFLSRSSPVTPKTRSPSPLCLIHVGLHVNRRRPDLRSLVSSSLDSLKHRLDALHGDSAHDLEASHSRISKRIKMQTQSSLQLAEEAEKEHRKMVKKISERAAEETKASSKKLVTEVQSSLSHGTAAGE